MAVSEYEVENLFIGTLGVVLSLFILISPPIFRVLSDTC